MLSKVSLALLMLAWAALAVAFVGVLSTPRSYCSELGTPPGQLAVIAGLVIAAGALIVGSYIEAARKSSPHEYLTAIGLGAGTVAVGIGVLVLEAHRVANWGCG
jgi:hypothetical protein